MGAKFSKGGKVKQNGTDAALDESLDTFNKTSTLPASFRKKDAEITMSGTLPRSGVDLNRSTSFSKRFRKSITKLAGQKEVSENEIASESQVPTEPSSVVLGTGECQDKLKDVIEEEVDSNERSQHRTPHKEVLVTPHREIDPKIAQKRARAQFFQELYNSKEPVHIPKPPRSRNIPSPSEKVDDTDSDVKVPAANIIGTPVVKLIEKHEEAIEKQHKHIEANNTINLPESERKETDSIINIPDVSSESIINEDVVCEKLVESIKQEEITKEEIILSEETILKEEIAMTQSAPKAPANDIVIEQGYGKKNEDIESNHKTESISENAKSVSDLIANETADMLEDVHIEVQLPEPVVTEAIEKKPEIDPSEIQSRYENGSVSFDTDGNSSDSIITIKEDGKISNDAVEENNTVMITEARSNEALNKNSEKEENEDETESIVFASPTIESGGHVLDVEIIEEVEVKAYLCGDDKNKPPSDEEIHLNVSMSKDEESKDDALEIENKSGTIPEIDLDDKLETNLTNEVNENLTESVTATSLSAENCEKCPDVENNKEQEDSMDKSSDNKENFNVDQNTENTASEILTEKCEIELDQDLSQSIDDNIMEGIDKAQYETEVANVEVVNSSHESCQVITEMASHEETNKIIDQAKSCNIEQKIQDDNFTELDSLESINQNDVIYPTVTEKDDTIESTGTRCLADDTVIVDSETKSPDDLRSEGGSEGGVSTDEGIVASDDEENKANFHKVDSLAADKNKSNDELSDPHELQNKL